MALIACIVNCYSATQPSKLWVLGSLGAWVLGSLGPQSSGPGSSVIVSHTKQVATSGIHEFVIGTTSKVLISSNIKAAL